MLLRIQSQICVPYIDIHDSCNIYVVWYIVYRQGSVFVRNIILTPFIIWNTIDNEPTVKPSMFCVDRMTVFPVIPTLKRNENTLVWGVVSLTFRELSKISRKHKMQSITFMLSISSWNIERVPQSMALGTRSKFQLEVLIRSAILVIYKFRETIFESTCAEYNTYPAPTIRDIKPRLWPVCVPNLNFAIIPGGRKSILTVVILKN